MDEQQFLTPKDVLGYAEEYIIIEKDKIMLNFSLSNSLDDIEIAIYTRTGIDVNLNDAYWQLNTNLSTTVKHLMNKHRVAYSMTTWDDKEDGRKYLLVNMRIGDKWFLTRFNEEDGVVYNYEQYSICKKMLKYFRDSDNDTE